MTTVSLRPIEAADEPFLAAVYASTRAAEMALVDWDAAQRAAFLQQQFAAQHAYYQTHYQATDFLIILVDGQPAGRLYVARWADEIRIVDITLLPPFQRQGIGTRLLTELFAEADRIGRPVRIHVETFNPALAFYNRLGFVPIADRGVYLFLERPTPMPTAGSAASR